MPNNNEDHRLQTVKGAMAFLGVGRDTIYRLHSRGEIEMIKVGRGTRVTQASLDQYVKNAKRLDSKRSA